MNNLEKIPKNPNVILGFKAPRGLKVPSHFDESKSEIFVKICQVSDWIKYSDLIAVEFLVDELFNRIEIREIADNFKDAGDWMNYNKFMMQYGRTTERAMKLLNSLGMTPKTCPKFVSHGPSQDKFIAILEGG